MGGLDLHQGYQAVNFRFVRDEVGEDAAEAKSFFTQRGSKPVFAGGGRVAFVEDQVDHLQNGGEAGSELGAARDFERHAGFGESAFSADDALGDGGLGDE